MTSSRRFDPDVFRVEISDIAALGKVSWIEEGSMRVEYEEQLDAIVAKVEGFEVARVEPTGQVTLSVPETPTSVIERLESLATSRWSGTAQRISLHWKSPPDPPIPAVDDRASHLESLDAYVLHLNRNSHRRTRGERPYRCPCCRFFTLNERGDFEICPVCFWEDDGQDDHDSNLVRGGPNYSLSLLQGRRNFAESGASREQDRPHVRAPTEEERGPAS